MTRKIASAKTRYCLETLRSHTRDIRLTCAEMVRQRMPVYDDALKCFENYFRSLEAKHDLDHNIRAVLATKFFNHWYSTLLLCEAGLMVDALGCERSALETMAYHWLIRLEPSEVDPYHEGRVLKPVEVRKRLEKAGANVDFLRASYAFDSGMTHVGREDENQNRSTLGGSPLRMAPCCSAAASRSASRSTGSIFFRYFFDCLRNR